MLRPCSKLFITIQCPLSLVCLFHHSTLVFSKQPFSYLSPALDFSKSMFWMISAPQFMASGCRRCADFWVCVLPIYAQLDRDSTSIFAAMVQQLCRCTFKPRHYKFVDKISHPATSPERSAEFVALATGAMHLGAGKKGARMGRGKLLAVLKLVLPVLGMFLWPFRTQVPTHFWVNEE